MTEAEWLACSDPNAMLGFLRECGRLSERKARLFACACMGRVWHVLPDERSRRAVEVAARFADGLADGEELQAAYTTAHEQSLEYNYGVFWVSTGAAAETCWQVAADAVEAVAARTATAIGMGYPTSESETGFDEFKHVAELSQQAKLLRCLFGSLTFRDVSIDPGCPRWNGGTILKLARVIYDERRFGDLPILADALEEAGCTDADLLDHCRQPGEHVRGCWVVDLILGKS